MVKFHRTVLRDDEPFDHTLEDWMRQHRRCFRSYIPPTTTTQRSVSIAHYLRPAIRSMITLVFDVHEGGYCIKKEAFNADNVVILRGQLKLKKLDLDEMTVSGRLENFDSLKIFIENVFFGGFVSSLPNDLKHLLSLLGTNPVFYRLLIEHHFALMNDISKKTFIDHLYLFQRQLSSAGQMDYSKACSRLSNRDDWWKLWESGSTLQNVYKRGLKKNLYSESEKMPDDQPKFYRYAGAHLIDSCKERVKETDPGEYTYEDCLDILLAVPEFAWNITRLAQYLADVNLLQKFQLDKYFDEILKDQEWIDSLKN